MNEPLSYGAYFNRSINLAAKHYSRLLPYSFILALYYLAISTLYGMIPFDLESKTLMILMGAWFLWIPLLAGYIHYHEHTLTQKKPPLWESMKIGYGRILPLFSTLLGLILGPGLLIGATVFVYLIALKQGFEGLWINIALWTLGLLGSILLMNARILSLPLVISSGLDSTMSIDKSKQLVHHHYLRTLFRSTLMFFIFLALIFAPMMILPILKQTLMLKLGTLSSVALLIATVLPYLWSFIVVDLHDLEHQRLKAAKKQKSVMQAQVKEAPKGTMKNEDWF